MPRKSMTCPHTGRQAMGVVPEYLKHLEDSATQGGGRCQVAALRMSDQARVAWTARDVAKAQLSSTLVAAKQVLGRLASEKLEYPGWNSGFILTLGFRFCARKQNTESNAVPYASHMSCSLKDHHQTQDQVCWVRGHQAERPHNDLHKPRSLSISGTPISTPLPFPQNSASKQSSHLKVAASCWIASTVCWLRTAKIWSSLEAGEGKQCWDSPTDLEGHHRWHLQ